MELLAWLAEPIRIWLEGGAWPEIKAAHGFQMLALAAAALVPSTLILIGIGGWTEWRETPLATWLGFGPRDPDEDWAERARDLDKDGTPDFYVFALRLGLRFANAAALATTSAFLPQRAASSGSSSAASGRRQ